VLEFISEDDLETFEGWLRYQGLDATTSPQELAMWRGIFDEARERDSGRPKVGLMKLGPVPPGEHRYAVAVRDGSDLWLTLWVRRSRKDELFVMIPVADQDWNPHTSYHRDGTRHDKSYGYKVSSPQLRQPLTGPFRGTENVGTFMGRSPKSVGAVCNPTAFSGVVEVGPDVLGPRNGGVSVDLVQPNFEPMSLYNPVVRQEVFRDIVPWIVIRIFS
jgi:hypothetical protein